MGYCAYILESDFRIDSSNVAAALAAVNAEFDGEFTSLVDAVGDLTSFEQCGSDDEHGFELGEHHDKYYDATDVLLDVLGRFAVEGSIARFDGEDGSLFGFRVVDGQLRTESGDYVWALDPELPPQPGQEVAA
jgi:hypothetical protein